MNLTLLKNCKFYQTDILLEDQEILIDEKTILAVGKAIPVNENIKALDLEHHLITPGFVDLQVNGGKQVFFNNNISVEALAQILQAHEEKGTRYLLPTLISSESANILKALEVVAEAMHQHPGILGLHLEGPFLNPGKHGGHNPKNIRKPVNTELDAIISRGAGVLKIVTIAPEIFSREQLLKLLEQDFVVSAGHSNATYEQAQAFFAMGGSCVTHLYNAMSSFQHREPGLTGAALSSPVYAGIIVDGVHSHYSAVKMAYELKKEKLFLISDASFIGLEQDEISFEGTSIHKKRGQFYTAGGNLAGSSITLHDALQNLVKSVGISLPVAIRMATEIPARLLGLEQRIGRIAVGNSSKLNVLDDALNLVQKI
ncbi:N-acetylglucosamine-6-phosphate deacetylase [Cesiribacter sp. SM1]|uniref:N-acetylglucosamine-6-phosphate deacetylase n=1 Tax=Cesiribacter sp. SM1 TaxID=2861196 RepID=UPI001CD714DE|nr:N-acetylglucosamine-6-phosphate deacetylase [Cesiribacter sp. SM1]